MKYYLINNKIMKASIEMPKMIHPTNFNYDTWLHTLKICDINDIELDKVIENRLNLLSICQETYVANNPIEVTDLIFDYGCDHDGVWREKLMFKEPTTINNNVDFVDFNTGDYDNTEYKGDVVMDRLVGWFRDRVEIKDHEVDYLKFIIKEYYSYKK